MKQVSLAALVLIGCLSACGGTSTDSPSLGTANFSLNRPASELMVSNNSYARQTSLASVALTPGLHVAVQGIGNSTMMLVSVRNETEDHWAITCEQGTKFEPAEGNAQSMVVTDELEVSVDKYEEQHFYVNVACLDISKAPPQPFDTAWMISKSSGLGRFISCVDGYLADAVEQDPDAGDFIRAARQSVMQLGLWQARGATEEDWIHYYIEYLEMTREQALQQLDVMRPFLQDLMARCPGL